MAIKDKKVSETYAGRDISSLSDRPNEDGLTGAQLKARFDQLGKEVIPNYNDLIDELNDVVLPSKADQSTTYTKIDVDLALTLKVDKEFGKSLVADATITDLTDGLDTTLHTHDGRYYKESETDVILALKSDVGHTHDDRYYTESESDSLLNAKVDKVAGQSLVSDSVMTDLTDLGNSSAHYHSTDRNTDNHTDGTTNKVFSATEKTKLAGVETGAEVNNISDINATDLTDGLNTTLHIHTADRDTDNHTDGVTNKVFTATEKTKLSGIEASANNYSHPSTHSADIIVDGTTNHTFTALDDTKLAGIETNANNYSHPSNHAPSIITQDSSNRFVSDTEKAYWNAKRDQIPNDELARVIESDFYSASVNAIMNILGVAISSGTVAAIASEPNHPGVISISDSTTANGGYRFMSEVTSLRLAGGEFCQLIFKPVSVRTTASFRFGFQDSTAIQTAPTDGVWIEVVGNATNPILSGKTNNNTGATTTGSTYTLTANTWYSVTIQLNSDATLATFTLYAENDTQLWQQTLATKIPTASGRETGFGVIAGETSTDAAGVIVQLDYISISINRTLVR